MSRLFISIRIGIRLAREVRLIIWKRCQRGETIKRSQYNEWNIRVNVILRHLIWENVDNIPILYKMCILMLWMASTRYYIHKKNKKHKKNQHRRQVIAPFKKIKNMLGHNLLSI